MKNYFRIAIFLSVIGLALGGAAAGSARRAAAGPVIQGCAILPADNIWNTPVDTLPLDPHSADYVASMGASEHLHPDFGAGLWDGSPIGIPYNVVGGGQAKVGVSFRWPDESDAGPYPIPANPLIEGGSDHHLLVIDTDHCALYELYNAARTTNGWRADSGAIFPLGSNGLRPAGWTSADAAGLPILPGLARYDEVASGEITHALRFTVGQSRGAYIWPARHQASDLTGSQYPPMGQRFRMKADYNLSRFSDPQVLTLLRALKKYGMIVADNGSDWYISGAPDERWNNDALVAAFHSIPGSAFEAVDSSSLMVYPDSGQTLRYAFSIWLPLVRR